MLPVSCYCLDGPAALCRLFLVPTLPPAVRSSKRNPPCLNLATLSSMATGSHHFHWADEQMVPRHWQPIGRWLHLCDFCHSFDPLLKMFDLSMEMEKWAELDEGCGHLSHELLFSMCLDGRTTWSIKAKEGAGSINTGH